jgi:hypothetical protein
MPHHRSARQCADGACSHCRRSVPFDCDGSASFAHAPMPPPIRLAEVVVVLVGGQQSGGGLDGVMWGCVCMGYDVCCPNPIYEFLVRIRVCSLLLRAKSGSQRNPAEPVPPFAPSSINRSSNIQNHASIVCISRAKRCSLSARPPPPPLLRLQQFRFDTARGAQITRPWAIPRMHAALGRAEMAIAPPNRQASGSFSTLHLVNAVQRGAAAVPVLGVGSIVAAPGRQTNDAAMSFASRLQVSMPPASAATPLPGVAFRASPHGRPAGTPVARAPQPAPWSRRRGCSTRASAVAAPARPSASTTKHRFRTAGGALMDCTVQQAEESYLVTVRLQQAGPKPPQAPPLMHWGLYRASPLKWHHPKEMLPPGSQLDEATGAMRTPMAAAGGPGQAWEFQLTLPAKMAPLQLGVVAFHQGGLPRPLPGLGSAPLAPACACARASPPPRLRCAHVRQRRLAPSCRPPACLFRRPPPPAPPRQARAGSQGPSSSSSSSRPPSPPPPASCMAPTGTGVYEAPLRGGHFALPVGMAAGDPCVLGPSIAAVASNGQGQQLFSVNFAVFSRNAAAMSLCLMRRGAEGEQVRAAARHSPARRLLPGSAARRRPCALRCGRASRGPAAPADPRALPPPPHLHCPCPCPPPLVQASGYLEVALGQLANRTGDVWHVTLHGLRDLGTLCYGWRASGAASWEGEGAGRRSPCGGREILPLPGGDGGGGRQDTCMGCWTACPAQQPTWAVCARPPPPAEGGTFHPGFLLLDPYCPLAEPVLLPDAAYTNAPILPPGGPLNTPVLQVPAARCPLPAPEQLWQLLTCTSSGSCLPLNDPGRRAPLPLAAVRQSPTPDAAPPPLPPPGLPGLPAGGLLLEQPQAAAAAGDHLLAGARRARLQQRQVGGPGQEGHAAGRSG